MERIRTRRRRRKGRGKAKGGAFEREICKKLSLWITYNKVDDCLWRSSLSGGRATVAHRKGVVVRQDGDICAVAPEGHAITDLLFVECKHVKRLQLGEFLVKGTGLLDLFWTKCKEQAKRSNKIPVIIAKQNQWPILWVMKYPGHHLGGLEPIIIHCSGIAVWNFEDLLNTALFEDIKWPQSS